MVWEGTPPAQPLQRRPSSGDDETYVRAFSSITQGAGRAGAAQHGLIFLGSAPGYPEFLCSSSFVLFSDRRPTLLHLYQVVN